MRSTFRSSIRFQRMTCGGDLGSLSGRTSLALDRFIPDTINLVFQVSSAFTISAFRIRGRRKRCLLQSTASPAFCYWHYWFGGGRRLLERPFDEVLKSGRPDFPFCLGWANQTWSGIWHGAPNRVLIEQTYPTFGEERDYRAHFEAILPAFMDTRYLRIDGRPLFFVFEPTDLPEPQRFLDLWRNWAADEGLPGIFFVGRTETAGRSSSADFDAFTPERVPPRGIAGTTGRDA